MGVGWPGSGGGGGDFPPTAPTIVPAWFRIGTFDYTDFSTDGDVYDLDAYTIPIKGVVHGLVLTPTIKPVGEALTSYTIEIGIIGELDRYQSPVDLLYIDPGAAVQVVTPPLLDQQSHGATTSLRITARSTGLGLDGLTAGAFTVDLLISVTP